MQFLFKILKFDEMQEILRRNWLPIDWNHGFWIFQLYQKLPLASHLYLHSFLKNKTPKTCYDYVIISQQAESYNHNSIIFVRERLGP